MPDAGYWKQSHAELMQEYRKLQAQNRALEERVRRAEQLLARADEHEFKGTTAENGDAHALVRSARAALAQEGEE